MSIDDMKEEFRMSFDRHDSWGHVMSAWFDIAEALHARGDDVPSHWGFDPGLVQEPEASWLHHCKSDVMSDFGEILCRWAGMLKSAGRDY